MFNLFKRGLFANQSVLSSIEIKHFSQSFFSFLLNLLILIFVLLFFLLFNDLHINFMKMIPKFFNIFVKFCELFYVDALFLCFIKLLQLDIHLYFIWIFFHIKSLLYNLHFLFIFLLHELDFNAVYLSLLTFIILLWLFLFRKLYKLISTCFHILKKQVSKLLKWNFKHFSLLGIFFKLFIELSLFILSKDSPHV